MKQKRTKKYKAMRHLDKQYAGVRNILILLERSGAVLNNNAAAFQIQQKYGV